MRRDYARGFLGVKYLTVTLWSDSHSQGRGAGFSRVTSHPPQMPHHFFPLGLVRSSGMGQRQVPAIAQRP
jgi:hypothetical protein